MPNNLTIPTRCIICADPVPEKRVTMGAITCSQECSDKRTLQKSMRLHDRECRYCRRPSTPAQRAAFQRFVKLEAKRPDLLYPKDFEKWQAEHGDPDSKNAALDFAAYRNRLLEEACNPNT